MLHFQISYGGNVIAIWVCDCSALNKIHVQAELSTCTVLSWFDMWNQNHA